MRHAPQVDAQTPFYRRFVRVAVPLLEAVSTRAFAGGEHVPPTGGLLVAGNHTSNADWAPIGLFLLRAGRSPRWLAKASLFRMPVVGAICRGVRHIPVERNTAGASSALDGVVAALRGGACIVMMPEGTFTVDPGRWPMRGRTGIVRAAFAADVPVLPVAQWGVAETLPPGSALPRRWGRVPLQVRAGAPVPLADLRARFEGATSADERAAVLHEGTERVMAAVTAELAVLRGEEAPAQLVDPGAYRGAELHTQRRASGRSTPPLTMLCPPSRRTSRKS